MEILFHFLFSPAPLSLLMIYFFLLSVVLLLALSFYRYRTFFFPPSDAAALPLESIAQEVAEEELKEQYSFQFPERSIYEESKRKSLLEHTGSSSSSLSSLASTDLKPLNDALIKRAIAVVEVAESLKKKIDKEGASFQLQWQVSIVEAGCRAVEEELKSVQAEAELYRPGLGQEILRIAASISLGQKQQKAAKKAQEDEAKKKKREEIEEKLRSEQHEVKKAKEAERAYQEMLREEERKSGKKKTS
jgi:hypothetical protein